MTDSSDSDEDDGIYGSYEDQVEAGGGVEAGGVGAAQAAHGDGSDTHMIDADPPLPSLNVAMNPEDMY